MKNDEPTRYVIEKNIPKPHKGIGRGSSKYPFMEMDVGDSVFVHGQKTDGPAYNSAKKYAQRSGFRFSAITIHGGVRIWREA